MNYKMGFTDNKPGGQRMSPNTNKMSGKRLNVTSSDLISKGSTNNSGNFRKVKSFNPFSGFNLGIFKRKEHKPGTSIVNNTQKVKNKKGRKAIVRKVFGILTGIFFFLFLVGVIVVGIYLKDIEQKLPKPGELIDRNTDQTTFIYDRNGVELYKIYPNSGTNRIYIKLSDLNKGTIEALLASEDSSFYEHKGVDWVGVIRCGWLSTVSYATQSGSTCGASTISQQLVRNTLMVDAFGDDAYERKDIFKTIQRKVREILMTIQVEQTLTKDEILERYINEVGTGGANNGFEAGAQSIFGKSAKDLTLAESAMMVGLLPAPERYNPVFGSQPEKAKDRQSYVFDMMIKHKDILGVNPDDVEKARKEELVYKTSDINITAPHFVFYVRNQLIEKYGIDKVERGGLKVTTTLDMQIQNIVQEELVNGVNETGHPANIYNGAAVGIDPRTEQIITMVGSVDYNNNEDRRVDGKVNDTLSPRQMGSSMKPYTYLTAFEQGYGPWLNTPDIKELNFNYDARNWDSSFLNFITLRQALVQSRNLPALYTIQLVGIPAFLQTAEKLGVTSLIGKEDSGLPLTLGASEVTLLEHTVAYSVFANEGVRKDPVSILKVTDKDGNILEEWKESTGTRVFDEKHIYLLNYTLCDLGGFSDQAMDFRYVENGARFACGKGGTNFKNVGPTDLVQMTYHKNFVLGLWMGNNDSTELDASAFSSTIPLPISIQIIKRIRSIYPTELFNRPDGVVGTTVCKSTGEVPQAGVGCDGYGQESSVCVVGQCPKQENRKRILVCKDSNKVPNNIDQARKFNLLKEIFLIEDYKIANTNQQAAFEKHISDPNMSLVLKMPDKADCQLPLGAGDSPVIDILTPVANKTYDIGNNVDITISYRVKNNVKDVKYYLDGVLIPGGTVITSPYNLSFVITGAMLPGTHTISATITDTDLKFTTATQTIIINEPVPVVPIVPIINVLTPVTGAVLPAASTLNLSAKVTVGTVGTLSFTITKTSGSFNTSVSGTNGVGGMWTASILPTDLGILPGTYTIVASGDDAGVTYSSPAITVTF